MKILGKTIYRNYLEKSDKDYINFIFTFFEDNNNVQFKLRGNIFNIKDLELFVEKIRKNQSCSFKQKDNCNNDEKIEIMYNKELEYFIFNYENVSIRYKKNFEIINLFDTFCRDLKSVY